MAAAAKNGAAKKAAPRTKGAVAEEDNLIDPAARVPVADEDDDGYHDQEQEWEDVRYGSEESESHAVFKDFTGGDKGISGKTDLTPKQAVFLWQLRNLEEAYAPEFPWLAEEIREAAVWFETYRLSINRGSRRETVDLFKGRMELGKQADPAASQSPLKF